MYLKSDFKNADENTIIGKAIKCRKLIGILKEFDKDVLLNCNDISNNINVLDEELNQLGYIDIGEDKFEEF
ncbi:hypothetical protein KAX02_05520 [candidate division WOR-3 bacterium]|nr:hypothetical protein [candidate division WOR-3 bacterium]